jgi:hypothetical protein
VRAEQRRWIVTVRVEADMSENARAETERDMKGFIRRGARRRQIDGSCEDCISRLQLRSLEAHRTEGAFFFAAQQR